MNFGERLRSLRKDIDYSLRRMADELGISFSALGKYERNERQPDFDTLKKIAEYFDVSIDWLLGRSSHPELTTNEDTIYKKIANESIMFLNPSRDELINHLMKKARELDEDDLKMFVQFLDRLIEKN